MAAVSATLGVSLLQKVLEIVAKRKSFTGDPGRLASLRQAARDVAERLVQYADEDIAAYRAYTEARRRRTPNIEPAESGTARALRDVVEVPIKAARSALAGLDLCADAAGIVRGAVAADLGTAAILLAGAACAMVLSAEVNLGQLPDLQQAPDRPATVECREIEERAQRQLKSVLRQVAVGAGTAHNL